MRLTGDLARGGHQAHWVKMFEASDLKNPLYLRFAWWVKDFFRPRPPLEHPGRILPGQPIQKIGTGYHPVLMPGEPTQAERRPCRLVYRYHD